MVHFIIYAYPVHYGDTRNSQIVVARLSATLEP